MEYIISYWQNALNFKGRARRKEYIIGCLGSAFALGVVSGILGFIGGLIDVDIITLLISLITMVLSAAVSVAGISCVVRRLHDIGKSGWLYFVCLLPCVGIFILLYWVLGKDSMPQPNQWGESPKYGGNGMGSTGGFGGFEQNNNFNQFAQPQQTFDQNNMYNQNMNGYGQNQYSQPQQPYGQSQYGQPQQSYGQNQYSQPQQNNNPYGY